MQDSYIYASWSPNTLEWKLRLLQGLDPDSYVVKIVSEVVSVTDKDCKGLGQIED